MDAAYFELDRCGAKNMPRVPQPGAKSGYRFEPLPEFDGPRPPPRRKTVRFRVKRLEGRLTGPITSAVVPHRVAFLDPPRVGEHEFEEIGSRGGAPDLAVEPFGDEPRQQPAVIDMGVGENDGIDMLRVEGKGLAIERLQRARSLEEAAIDEQAFAAVTIFHA